MGMMLHRHKELESAVTSNLAPVTDAPEPKPEVKRTRKARKVEQTEQETEQTD